MLTPMSALAVRSLAVAVALAAGCALFAETHEYGLLGFDTFPLIVSSRVESGSDLAGLFGERLMDGRYPSAFYRPLTSASFALDYALWGLDPFGYQLTSALIFTALLLALAGLGFALGRERAGVRAPWWGVALPALFALHPSWYEVVPIPARRADLLCCAFTAAAVGFAIARRAWAAGCAALLAIAAKESGYAVPLLIAAAAWLFDDARRARSRAAGALRVAAPALAVAGCALAVRFAILGSVGGHRAELSATDAISQVPGIAVTLLRGVALSGAAGQTAAWTALLVGLGLAFFGLAAAREQRAANPQARALGLGVCWIAVFALTYAAAGWIGAWYYMLPAVGAAIVLTALVAWLVHIARLRDERGLVRASCALAALLLVAVAGWQASFSPFFRHYGEWGRATGVAAGFLDELDERIRESSAGSVIEAPALPMWALPREGVPGVSGAAIFSDYSVQAWADLVHPDRRVRVLGLPEGILPPGPDTAAPGERVVRISRRQPGY